MKKWITLLLLFSVAGTTAQVVPSLPAAPAAVPAAAPLLTPDPQLLDHDYLSEITRHLYRWYMDEEDVDAVVGIENFPFWVRQIDVKLDPGDHSQFAEIVLPLTGFSTKVKKADYPIDDLGAEAKSDTYRIVNVSRIPIPEEKPPEYTAVELNYKEMKDYLFRTRSQAQYPNQAMRDHLRPALMSHLGLNPAQRKEGEQIIHMAPLSPVANELWIFWENGKMLIRFASDIDLENPAMWEHQALGIRTYDIEEQTVVSLNEVPGSNEFMTRDQVGRALFNCVILGERLSQVNPPQGTNAPASPVAE
jgi:hypothetical protein